jgi:hypothetical protein
VFIVLVALGWWVVMRWLNNDGFPVRRSLDQGRSVQPDGLGQAKDRNVAQTWDSEL